MVGYIMEGVDMVLVGAEGVVVENGGIVNKTGVVYAVATYGKEHRTPFYMASENHKFARLYP
jgi:translation initiation factor 2B subunit (eIF-2B alpha/beta/delta family)